MHIDIAGSSATGSDAAVTDLLEQLQQAGGGPADFVFLGYDAGVSPLALARLVPKLHVAAVHGASTCPASAPEGGTPVRLAAFVIRDPEGDYGTARADFAGDPRIAASEATMAALARAGREGEIPDAIWLTATPGAEDAAIAGIQDVAGAQVPIVGGSATGGEGAGYVLSSDGFSREGLTVSVLFPSTRIETDCRCRLAPAGPGGIVTQSDGRRLIAIDGRPAAQVCAEWSGTDTARTGQGGADPGAMPLGQELSVAPGVSTYLPLRVAVDGNALLLGAEVPEGARIALLRTRPNGSTSPAKPRGLAGVLSVTCRELDVGSTGMSGAVPDGIPALVLRGSGVQGPVPGGGNRHGNGMTARLLFKRVP